MSDENEYSGSGHFVGESEQAAPKAAKKSSVAERQVVKNNGATVAEAKDVNNTQVGQNAVAISEAMGNPEPPIGDVLTGVGKQLAPYAIGGATMLGLKKAWDVLSSQQAQTSNDGAKGGWDRTTAGKPSNATLGAAPEAAPVPAAATTAAPIPEAAPVAEAAPKAAAIPAATFPATATQQPSISGYGETTTNAPTGAPNVAVAPPAEAAAAPVEPKPISRLEELRIQKAEFDLEAAKAKEARAAEAHASRLAADVKRAEAKAQTKTASGAISPEDQKMLQSSEKAKIEKAIVADQKAVAAKKAAAVPAASVVPTVEPVVATPAAAPAVAPAPAAAPVAEGSAVPPKGAKWPGGAEGSAVQLFGGTKKNFTPESQAAVEMFKDFVGGPLSMPPTGGSINQIPEASKFYEKHTGEPLPRNAEGKLTRIPEEQMQKLHTGIRTELEDAVKGNKLGSLGKGAMAAAALLGLTGAVQAAQKGDFGPLRQAGFDIGGPVALGKLGIAALSRAAGTGFSAATYSGDLNEGEQKELARRRHDYMMKESQKLGSPLRSVPPPR